MAEYWKSTPSWFCKFCQTYVKETPIERRNHEQSGKHLNNIQKSIRDLTKTKERELRDQQRAKDEVARLNGLVGGKSSANPAVGGKPTISGVTHVGKQPAAPLSGAAAAAQRKAHAEQLAALGVELPEELKKEVTGVGSWQTVSEQVVEEQPWSLAGIKNEDSKEDVKLDVSSMSRGVRKRKPEEDEDEEQAARRQGWGSRQKKYPGEDDGVEDLDALLSGVAKTKKVAADEFKAKTEVNKEVKDEADKDGSTSVAAASPGDTALGVDRVKQEDDAPEAEAPPAVVFKKRKVKR